MLPGFHYQQLAMRLSDFVGLFILSSQTGVNKPLPDISPSPFWGVGSGFREPSDPH